MQALKLNLFMQKWNLEFDVLKYSNSNVFYFISFDDTMCCSIYNAQKM